MKSSERWYWCHGCGAWHDSDKRQSQHFCMYVCFQEPCERNFEGTADELARFIAARKLRAEDAAEFERRVDAQIGKALQ
jgi:hypothetical protein